MLQAVCCLCVLRLYLQPRGYNNLSTYTQYVNITPWTTLNVARREQGPLRPAGGKERPA